VEVVQVSAADDLRQSRRADRPVTRAGVSDHGRSSNPEELTVGTPCRRAVSIQTCNLQTVPAAVSYTSLVELILL